MRRPLISIAPMFDISHRHFRFFTRLLTSQATLYTEMIHENAINNTQDKNQLLGFNECQHPLVLQIGGSDTQQLNKAAKIGEQFNYDQINLNVGCPSKAVQKGSFGACLMKKPYLVSEYTRQILKNIKIPCTVKCRIGVDSFDSYQFLKQFINQVSCIGKVDHFIIHARKAFLKGLNPAKNRSIPPLKYQYVFSLKKDFPSLKFTLNGGIKTIKQAKQILNDYDLQGIMIGRTAYQNPWELTKIDSQIFNNPSINYSKKQILQIYSEYSDKVLENNPNIAIHTLIKPILNIFNGNRGNSKYRQFISNINLIKDNGSFTQAIHRATSHFDKNILELRKYDN